MSETIFALSSASGKAGVCVVRVSGPAAFSSLKILARLMKDPVPRYALFKNLYDGSGAVLDKALVLPFCAPASFTGEDVVEYHLHGSLAVLDIFLKTLSSFDDHRMAEHGEFTRRAFENGKMDLTEAEAIADLIDAETQAQRAQALLQMDGALSRLYEDWRTRLIKAMAYVETVIDFPDEDIPDSETAKAFPAIDQLIAEIEAHLNDNRRGERLRDGIHIAVIGAPNAGKSSLVNALAKRDVAIVSPMAGTTRDVIEAHLDLGGYPVILSDTAGLRADDFLDDAQDGHALVEAEGVRRAKQRAIDADLRLLLFDGTDQDAMAETMLWQIEGRSFIVFNKADAPGFKNDVEGALSVSVRSGENMESLVRAISQKVESLYAISRETPSLTRARHRDALEQSLSRLKASKMATLPELMAEDIRMAMRAIGRITGRIDVEDLLDVIFRDFCIGK